MDEIRCPRFHGSLSKIALNADIGSERFAYLCSFCGGVHIKAQEWHDILHLESSFSKDALYPTRIPMVCESCNEARSIVLVDELPVFYCARCESYWLDAGIFPVLLSSEVEKQTGAAPSNSPFSPLNISCCDCGVNIASACDAHACPIGMICTRCYHAPPGFMENKVNNFQMLTFKGMEVKVEHWGQSVRSLIAVTPAQPCLLNVRLHSLSLQERILRFGRRRIAFAGALGKKIDADQDIKLRTPFKVFLSQRGVVALINDIASLGSMDLQFRPHNLSFELHALRISNEIRLHFEVAVRRLLIAYSRFAELSELYR
ncbi:MAG: hypothetical protein ACOX8U_08650 [Bradymonadia bacterium]|jgi:hypothetical protein